MSNRVTLDQLDGLTIMEVAGLPADQIAMLDEETKELEAKVKAAKDKLHAAKVEKFAGRAQTMRQQTKKTTGVVHLIDGDCSTKCDLPPKVVWDQDKLAEGVEVIRGWGEDINEYVDVTYKIPENRYKGWPKKIRDVFEPARTLDTGKPNFEIKTKKAEAA